MESGNEIRGAPFLASFARSGVFHGEEYAPHTAHSACTMPQFARCAACRATPQLSHNHLFLPLRRNTPTCDPSHCLPASTAAEFTSSPGRHPSLFGGYA